MKQNITSALRLTAVCLLFFCGFYIVLVLGAAQLAPTKGQGVVVNHQGRSVHLLVGQGFSSQRY
nr:potassium-transporting ATPase subunit C [Spirosomataceae bacterium]